MDDLQTRETMLRNLILEAEAKIQQRIEDTRQHYADGLINETEMRRRIARLESAVLTD